MVCWICWNLFVFCALVLSCQASVLWPPDIIRAWLCDSVYYSFWLSVWFWIYVGLAVRLWPYLSLVSVSSVCLWCLSLVSVSIVSLQCLSLVSVSGVCRWCLSLAASYTWLCGSGWDWDRDQEAVIACCSPKSSIPQGERERKTLKKFVWNWTCLVACLLHSSLSFACKAQSLQFHRGREKDNLKLSK